MHTAVWRNGKTLPCDLTSEDQWLSSVYQPMRRLASVLMRRERRGHTLQPTALVHEALMRLRHSGADLENKDEFLCAAAREMRHLLVEHARKRNRARHGGRMQIVGLDALPPAHDDSYRTTLLGKLLTQLEGIDPRAVQVVELSYFAGLTHEEIAETLGVAVKTVGRDWAFARAWLHDALSKDCSELVPINRPCHSSDGTN